MAVDSPSHMNRIRSLLGDISESDLLNVDCYLSTHLGLFIPSLGYCGMAVRPRHTHPSYSFILFPSQDQYFKELAPEVIPGQYLTLAISPGIPHQEPVEDSFKRYFAICIAGNFYESQYAAYDSGPPEICAWTSFYVSTEVMASIKGFMSEYENRYPGREKILDAIALIITHQLIRSQLNLAPGVARIITDTEVEKAVWFMHQHYGEPISIARLAALARLSESHFHKIFKRATGLSPMEYLNEIRLSNAKKLLRAGKWGITQIALQCGFNSTSHFSSRFAKKMGLSPKKYLDLYNSHGGEEDL